MFEVFEPSHLFRTRARRSPSNGESRARGPRPWLPRVESLELRWSQRKTPSVRREQQLLRGSLGTLDLDSGQHDSLISIRAVATRVTHWCPDSLLRDTAAPSREVRGLISRRRREREGEGKAGERLRPPPPGSSAIRDADASRRPGSPRKDHREPAPKGARASAGDGEVDGDSIVVRRARRSTKQLV